MVIPTKIQKEVLFDEGTPEMTDLRTFVDRGRAERTDQNMPSDRSCKSRAMYSSDMGSVKIMTESVEECSISLRVLLIVMA